MTSDPLYIGLSRDETSRVINFLEQYRDYLSKSDYVPHQYRADAIDGLIAEIQKKVGIVK